MNAKNIQIRIVEIGLELTAILTLDDMAETIKAFANKFSYAAHGGEFPCEPL